MWGASRAPKRIRGKHCQAYRADANLVLLSPDVDIACPINKAVKDTFRLLIDVARRSTRRAKRPVGGSPWSARSESKSGRCEEAGRNGEICTPGTKHQQH